MILVNKNFGRDGWIDWIGFKNKFKMVLLKKNTHKNLIEIKVIKFNKLKILME